MYTTWKWFISCHYVYNHHNLLANCLETKRFNSWRLSFYWLGIRTIEIVTQWCQRNFPNLFCCEGQDSTDNKRSKHAFRQYLVPKSHSHLHPRQLPPHIKVDDPEPILNQNVYSLFTDSYSKPDVRIPPQFTQESCHVVILPLFVYHHTSITLQPPPYSLPSCTWVQRQRLGVDSATHHPTDFLTRKRFRLSTLGKVILSLSLILCSVV